MIQQYFNHGKSGNWIGWSLIWMWCWLEKPGKPIYYNLYHISRIYNITKVVFFKTWCGTVVTWIVLFFWNFELMKFCQNFGKTFGENWVCSILCKLYEIFAKFRVKFWRNFYGKVLSKRFKLSRRKFLETFAWNFDESFVAATLTVDRGTSSRLKLGWEVIIIACLCVSEWWFKITYKFISVVFWPPVF